MPDKSTRAQRWAQELSNKGAVKMTKQQEEKHTKNIAEKKTGSEAAALILTERSLTVSLKEVFQIFNQNILSPAKAVWSEGLLLGGSQQINHKQEEIKPKIILLNMSVRYGNCVFLRSSSDRAGTGFSPFCHDARDQRDLQRADRFHKQNEAVHILIPPITSLAETIGRHSVLLLPDSPHLLTYSEPSSCFSLTRSQSGRELHTKNFSDCLISPLSSGTSRDKLLECMSALCCGHYCK